MTTIGDHRRAVRHLGESPLNGVRLRMAIPLSNGDRTVSRNAGKGKGIAARHSEIRQGRVSQAVGLEWFDLGVFLRVILVSPCKRRERPGVLCLASPLLKMAANCTARKNPSLGGVCLGFMTCPHQSVHGWDHREDATRGLALSLGDANQPALAIQQDVFPSELENFSWS